jgi:octaprenyl-diphosphate synthase
MAAIEPEIAMINRIMRSDLAEINSPALRKVLEHAALNGGKRIRPALTIFAARLTTHPHELPDSIYRLAVAFEYLHTASLLHDDVIDHADHRRGNASANSLWGNTPVILAGDYLLARAMLLAGTVADANCLGLIGQALIAMTEAEFLQLETSRAENPSEEDYFAVLQGKTGALIAAACEAGALLAAATPRQQNAIRIYGNNLGLAFQLVDDLLDYLGDPEQTGKPAGNDLCEGKMTLPLIHALQRADAADRSCIQQLFAMGKSDRSARLDEVRAIIEKHDGFTYTREKASLLVRAALDELEQFPSCPAREVLAKLADYVLTRKK